VVLCAVSVIVFLAVTLPSVFDVKHSKHSYVIAGPVDRIVLDTEGTSNLDITPSRDGRVHVRRSSSVSMDSRLIASRRLSGKTLTLKSSCTGSRLGLLRRCDIDYMLQVPRKAALSINVHLG
jgi:hypothetical protein